MNRKKAERVLCDNSIVEINRQRGGGRWAVIEYDMWKTGERMSREAFDRLCAFLTSYYKANRPRLRRPRSCMGRTAGYFRVLPEHRDEMAARLLLHLTDPVNYDPVTREQLREFHRQNADCSLRVYGIDFDSRERQVRDRIVAEYPDWVDDPLGEIPGAGEVAEANREEPCRG